MSEGAVISQLEPESKTGDWLFIESVLMPISDAYFIVVQTYEHSRGGTLTDALEAYSTDSAKLLWKLDLEGYDTKTYLLDEAKQQLYLLQRHPKNRPFDRYKGYIGSDLVCFELKDLKEFSRYHVCYPEEKLSEQAAEGRGELMKLIKWGM